MSKVESLFFLWVGLGIGNLLVSSITAKSFGDAIKEALDRTIFQGVAIFGSWIVLFG